MRNARFCHVAHSVQILADYIVTGELSYLTDYRTDYKRGKKSVRHTRQSVNKKPVQKFFHFFLLESALKRTLIILVCYYTKKFLF